MIMAKQLKKVVYALTEHKLKKNIKAHEERGWVQASDLKEHGYGNGVLMTWGQESPLERRANS
jgi:hypothetical protein